MSAKTIAMVGLKYSNYGNAMELPEAQAEKLKQYWNMIQNRRGKEFFYEVCEEIVEQGRECGLID